MGYCCLPRLASGVNFISFSCVSWTQLAGAGELLYEAVLYRPISIVVAPFDNRNGTLCGLSSFVSAILLPLSALGALFGCWVCLCISPIFTLSCLLMSLGF